MKLSLSQVATMQAATEAYPAWFRARTSGERVTLASLWRNGFMERRVWRPGKSSADNAHEYRPTEAFIESAKRAGLK